MRRSGASLEEIEAVYRRRLPELRRLAAAIVGDRDAGRDAVQDAFASVVCARAAFRGEGTLEGWIWRAVVNAARDRRRDRPSVPLDEAVARNGAPLDEAGDRVRLAVALLPERQRLVLFLRFYADLDYATIAEALGISLGTVGATLTAARESVRRHLEEVET